MRKIRVLYLLRLGAFFSFLCILMRFFIKYDFADPILLSLPFFTNGFLGGEMIFPGSHLALAIEDKGISSLLYPALVNVIFWLPIKKAYHSLYGIIWVEKWKTQGLIIIYCLNFIVTFPTIYFSSNRTKHCIIGLFISIAYYIYLKYSLKAIKKNDFLVYAEVNDCGDPIDRKKLLAIALIHFVAFFSMLVESSIKTDDARMMVEEIKIPGVFIKDISPDGERILLLKKQLDTERKQEKNHEMIMSDTKGECIWKKKGIKSEDFMGFLKENRYVYLVGRDNKKQELYDIKTGDMVRSFELEKYSAVGVKNIEFSKDDLFLSNTSWGSTIWNYDSGVKVVTYENFKGRNRLIWVDENSYILFRKYELNEFYNYGIEISLNIISPNGSLKNIKKSNITDDMKQKLDEVGFRTIFIKNIDENSICTVVGGGNSSFFSYLSYIDFWDVESENKIFSLVTGNEVLDIIFLPEKNRFIIVERMRNLIIENVRTRRIRVSFWNLKEKKREGIVFLKGIEENVKRDNFRVIKDATELAVLSDFSIKLWKID